MMSRLEKLNQAPVKALKIAYFAAVCLLILLALASHFILKKQISDNEAGARLVNMSQSLRTSALKVALIARNLVSTVNLTERENLRKELQHEARRIEEAQAKLVGGEGTRTHSPEIRRIFFSKPILLNGKISEFIAASRGLSESRDPELGSENPDMKYIRREATGNAFLADLDYLTRRYQLEMDEQMGRLQYFETLIIIVQVMTLLLTALFTFRPLAARVQEEIEGLNVMNTRLSQRVAERTAVAEKSEERLKESEKLAILDPLTELLNRRGLQQALAREVRAKAQGPGDLIVLIVDLDDFKGVNDRYSHAVGDEVLKKIANVLRSSLRAKDTICRLGGDEFIVLLPHTSPSDAFMIAEELRQAISDARHTASDLEQIRVSASLGLIALSDPETSVNELLRLTHSVLYKSKEAGKNRVSTEFQPPRPMSA